MTDVAKSVKRIANCTPSTIPPEVFDASEPVLLEGLVGDWPAVRGCGGLAEAGQYLQPYFTEHPVTAYIGPPSIGGRFFYNDEFTGFNFRSGSAPLEQVLLRLAEQQVAPDKAQAIYVGSTMIDRWLPGFRDNNDIPIPFPDPLVSFWLGNQTSISAHYDFPDNMACVVSGERRFTLFPPEQVSNLYVGPVDQTPSGQAVSMVDFRNPDLHKFPKFAQALEHAQIAEMKAGDALFIPSMWWHQVEAFSQFNLLVNYWWCNSLPALGSPSAALMNAMLSIRDLPKRQREGWKHMFEHYVFSADEETYAHIPEVGRGSLSPLDDTAARRLRANLLNKLNQ
ncbi:cupin-like domain-containing protein [Pseudomonadales bacterium]|nr:cupin-like domain-containing protein [Pseudomonadales bacterium]